jgi:hypothetical protein
MSTPPSEDERLRLARQDGPRPRLLQSAVTNPELQVPSGAAVPPPASSRALRITLIVAVALFLIAAIGGILYWIQSRRYPVVVTIGVPEERAAANVPGSDKLQPLVPVRPEMLHVTSIALGEPRLTIVNGKRLGEGDWLVLNTPLGAASVRVISIEDGLVRFRHGGETIDVKLQSAQATSR